MNEFVKWAVFAIIIVVVLSFIGAIYGESTSDNIVSSTNGTLFEAPGTWIAPPLHDLGHSLRVTWIFVGIVIFVIACIIVYIKTRPKQPSNDYYNPY